MTTNVPQIFNTRASDVVATALGEHMANWMCFNPYINCYTRIVTTDIDCFVVQPKIEEYALRKCLYSKLSPAAKKVASLICYSPTLVISYFKNPENKSEFIEKYSSETISLTKIKYYLVETEGWTHKKAREILQELRDFISLLEKEE